MPRRLSFSERLKKYRIFVNIANFFQSYLSELQLWHVQLANYRAQDQTSIPDGAFFWIDCIYAIRHLIRHHCRGEWWRGNKLSEQCNGKLLCQWPKPGLPAQLRMHFTAEEISPLQLQILSGAKNDARIGGWCRTFMHLCSELPGHNSYVRRTRVAAGFGNSARFKSELSIFIWLPYPLFSQSNGIPRDDSQSGSYRSWGDQLHIQWIRTAHNEIMHVCHLASHEMLHVSELASMHKTRIRCFFDMPDAGASLSANRFHAW